MKQAIKKSLCTLLAVVLMLTAVPLSGFVGMDLSSQPGILTAQAAIDTAGISIETDWLPDDQNCIAVKVFITDAVDLKEWDLHLFYDADVFDFNSSKSGKDAEAILLHCNSNFLTYETNGWNDGEIGIWGKLSKKLWDAETFLANSNWDGDCIVNDKKFEFCIYYLKITDKDAFNMKSTTISVSGTFFFDEGTKQVSSSITKADAPTITSYNTGDIIEFGLYPQREVTDAETLSELNSLSLNWVSYGYYEKGSPVNYMQYADVDYKGEKYRAVKFSKYRHKWTILYSWSTTEGSQKDNGYYINQIYWFKYEPIQWIVVDPSDGLLISSLVLDSQAFGNNGINDYFESSLRTWLNDTFYNTAMLDEQSSLIQISTLDNSSPHSGYGSATSYDKIFVPSLNEVKTDSFWQYDEETNFVTANLPKATDYAEAQGLRMDQDCEGIPSWRLRTASYTSNYGYIVDALSGNIADKASVDSANIGIRPAMRIDLDKMNPDTSNQYEGICGDNLSWTLSSGKLTIAGDGEIPDYDKPEDVPWYASRALVNTVVLSEKVRKIGSYAFYDCDNITEIALSSYVKRINDNAFNNCDSLQKIAITNPNCIILQKNSISSKAVIYGHAGSTAEKYAKDYNRTFVNMFASDEYVSLVFNKILYTVEQGNSIPVFGTCTMPQKYSVPTLTYTCNNTSAGNRATLKVKDAKVYPVSLIADGVAERSFGAIVTADYSSPIGVYELRVNTPGGKSATCMIEVVEKQEKEIADAQTKQILDQVGFDIDDLDLKIELDGGKIKGPSFTVLGKEVQLFEYDCKVNIPYFENFSVKVDPEEKLIKVLIGFKQDEKATIGADGQSTTYWSESYREVKKMYQNVTGNKVSTTKLWNDFSHIRGKLKKVNGSLGFAANAYLAGYMEFSYDKNSFSFSEGGILAELGFDSTLQGRIPNMPIGYFELGLGASANGTIKVMYQKKYDISGALGGEIHASIAAGIGEKKLTATYLEIKAKSVLDLNLNIPVQNLKDSMTINMAGDIHLYGYCFGHELVNESLFERKFQLYPTFKSLNRTRVGASTEKFSHVNAVPIEREYNINNFTLADNGSFALENIYPYSTPQLIQLADGRRMLIWLDDDGTKSDLNRTSLMYSICENGHWSAPDYVDKHDGYNGTPIAYAFENEVYIIWQQCRALTTEEGFNELLQGLELCYVVYDGVSFSETVQITADNNLAEFNYRIAANENGIGVAWMENSENDLLMSTGINSICYTEIKDNIVGNVERVYADAIPAEGLLLNATDNAFEIIYSIVNAENVSEVYCYTDGKIDNIISSDGRISALDSNNGQILFLMNEELFLLNKENGSVVTTGLVGITNYEYIESSDVKKVYTIKENNDGSILCVSVFDEMNEEWSEFATCYSDGCFIRNYNPVIDAEGNISVVINAVEYLDNQETLYGDASLYVLDTAPYFDLIVGNYLDYNDSLLLPNEALPLMVEVKNDSTKTVEKIYADIKNLKTQEVQKVIVPCLIESNETATLELWYELGSEVAAHEIEVFVYSDYQENNTENNTAVALIGLSDLVLDDICFETSNDKKYVVGKISNTGYAVADNVSLVVNKDNRQGEEVIRKEIGSLAVGETFDFSYEINDSVFYSNGEEKALYIYIDTDNEEGQVDNNTRRIVYTYYVDVDEDYSCTDHHFNVVQTNPSCTQDGQMVQNCLICGAIIESTIPSLGHTEEVLAALAPTCTTSGLTEGKKCTVCGEVTVAQTEIAKLAHSKVTVNQKAATATENGYTGDVVCSVCGTEISKGKVIPATGDAGKNCDHICHKDGFIGFIWKIVQFFWKLFKMNPVCECGKAHY